jgi:phosphomannomutase
VAPGRLLEGVASVSAGAAERARWAACGLAGPTPAWPTRGRAVTRELGEAGRVLIRPSGTEPVLRIMVEARQEGLARRAAQTLAESLAA